MCTVLIADDVSAYRNALRLVLSLDDSIRLVAEAADGAEAVRLALEHEPHVCILDISMPIMDGFAAAAGIKAARPTTRVLMHSGLQRGQVLRDLERSGADEYLEKGASPTTLINAVRSLCAKCEGSA